MKKRFRHVVVFALLRPFFYLFLKIKFGFKAKRFKPEGLKGPYLICANHALALDPFFVSISFKGPIYYVATDMIFSIPFWSRIMKYLVQPIPKTKYRSDMETIRDVMRVVKSGGSIGLFPEGNATFNGAPMHIDKAVAKLIKLLKIPVLFYHLEGGYLSKPRWAKKVRKGKMYGEVKHIITPSMYKAMSIDELHKKVLEYLDVNAFNDQKARPIAFHHKTLAEDIESAYFYCPNCQAFSTLHSKNDRITCTQCAYQARYTPNGWIEPLKEVTYYDNTVTWYLKQKAALHDYLDHLSEDRAFFTDSNESVYIVIKNKRKNLLDTADIELYQDRFIIKYHHQAAVTLSLDNIQSSVQQKNKLIIYDKLQKETYYFINAPKRNALKYVLAIEYLTKGERT